MLTKIVYSEAEAWAIWDRRMPTGSRIVTDVTRPPEYTWEARHKSAPTIGLTTGPNMKDILDHGNAGIGRGRSK